MIKQPLYKVGDLIQVTDSEGITKYGIIEAIHIEKGDDYQSNSYEFYDGNSYDEDDVDGKLELVKPKRKKK